MSNGKGDKPRNCFSKQFKDNYEEINWGDNRPVIRRTENDIIVFRPETVVSVNIDEYCHRPSGSFKKFVKENPVI